MIRYEQITTLQAIELVLAESNDVFVEVSYELRKINEVDIPIQKSGHYDWFIRVEPNENE